MKLLILLLFLCSCGLGEILINAPLMVQDSCKQEFLEGYTVFYSGENLGFYKKQSFPLALGIKNHGFQQISLFPVYKINEFSFESLFPALGISPMDLDSNKAIKQLSTDYKNGIFSLTFLNFEKSQGLKNINPTKFCETAFKASKENPFSLNIEKLKRDALEGKLNRYSFSISMSLWMDIPENFILISENPFRSKATNKIEIFSGLERFFVFNRENLIGIIGVFLDKTGEIFTYDYYGEVSKFFAF